MRSSASIKKRRRRWGRLLRLKPHSMHSPSSETQRPRFVTLSASHFVGRRRIAFKKGARLRHSNGSSSTAKKCYSRAPPTSPKDVDSLASTSVETEERQQYSPALTRSLPWRSQTCTVLSATLWTCAIVPRRVPHGEHLLAYPRLESMTQRCTRQIRDWKPPHDASPEATFKVSNKRSNWQEEARPRI